MLHPLSHSLQLCGPGRPRGREARELGPGHGAVSPQPPPGCLMPGSHLPRPAALQTGPEGRAGGPGSGSRASGPLPLRPGRGVCSLPPVGPPLGVTQGVGGRSHQLWLSPLRPPLPCPAGPLPLSKASRISETRGWAPDTRKMPSCCSPGGGGEPVGASRVPSPAPGGLGAGQAAGRPRACSPFRLMKRIQLSTTRGTGWPELWGQRSGGSLHSPSLSLAPLRLL